MCVVGAVRTNGTASWWRLETAESQHHISAGTRNGAGSAEPAPLSDLDTDGQIHVQDRTDHTITAAELEALFAYEWRSRVTAAWLVGVGRRTSFRERIGGLLLDSEVCYSGKGHCFALARLGTQANVEILTAYLDRYLPRTDLRYDQPEALGALLRLDAQLGTHHADRFTEPDGLRDHWVQALGHLNYHSSYTPDEQRRWIDLQCDVADGWSRP